MTTDVFDSVKARSSCCPNFVHYLNATVLCLVLNKCEKENIPIFTAHDAFMVDIEHIEKIKKMYFDSFNEVFFKERSPYLDFVELNKKELTPIDQILLDKIKENRLAMKLKLESGEFVMSKFILTP